MGSAQSLLSPQTTLGALLVAGAAAYGYAQSSSPAAAASTSSPAAGSPEPVDSKKKRKKGAKAPLSDSEKGATAGTAAATVVPFPPVIPGDFAGGAALDSTAPETEGTPATAASKPKGKKKKAKKAAGAGTGLGGGLRPVPADALSESSATAPESTAAQRPAPSSSKRRSAGKVPQIQVEDVDEQWTRVETRRQKQAKEQASSTAERPLEVSTSDLGVTTSSVTGTGNSSPTTERTEDEQDEIESGDAEEVKRKTLAEKLLPKPRKTGVEDMLETPDHPTIARVMRIQPAPGEKPAAGFSWGDYEDVDTRTADDADGEDDGGWGIVKSRRAKPTRTTSQQPQTEPPASSEASKKQRQNANKREAQKAAKADAEAERLARLAAHKRELERTKIAEQYAKAGKGIGGGMSAFVDEDGKLVWK